MRRPAPPLRRALAAAALALALLAAAAPAQPNSAASPAGEPEIPQPTGFVNDVAGLMDEPRRTQLEAFLDQVKRKTGVEFALLTVPTTAPLDPAEYKVKVFERWRLGQRGKDTGLLLLVAVAEHRIWFETGYGLEGTLPDGLQARIIREEMTPRFRAGDVSGGITAAVLRTSERIAKEQGVRLEWNGRELRDSGRRSDPGRVVALMIALGVFVIVAILVSMASPGGYPVSPRRRRYRHGWGPWYGGWGGGFGGGSSGGFGGGGSSFGGFGGGASGGGGGGGSW